MDATKKNVSADNVKRLQSLKNMKKGFQKEKALVTKALSSIDSVSNRKIIFSETTCEETHNGESKLKLFNENSDCEDDFTANFEVKKQFEGETGQKLLQLQAKFKHDKRFHLDERFLDNEQNEIEQHSSRESLESEKKTEAMILEEVLGKKLTKRSDKSVKIDGMLRFDPSHPNHSNLEMKNRESNEKLEKADKMPQDEELPKPEVTKEVFYKVSDNLKELFEKKQDFNLLGTNKKSDVVYDDQLEDESNKFVPSNIKNTPNPFKYDSSDDEMEDIPHKIESTDIINPTDGSTGQGISAKKSVFWTEPFFFKFDDYRLQDGFDFIEKIKGEHKEFSKIRQGLKSVVRTKIRNTEKKNKMFKKKLGSSQRKKQIRIKKALKR